MAAMTVQTFPELLGSAPFSAVPSSFVEPAGLRSSPSGNGRSDMLIGVVDTEEGVPAEFRICSLLHYATIEPLNPATTESPN
jgi:hypothetical protein